MNALQTHFWAVRDYLSPVLRESKFKEHGRITPDEFVAAGDFLAYKFPTWSWSPASSSALIGAGSGTSGSSSADDASKYTRDFLPKDKQYLISRGVPCLRRVSAMEKAAAGSGKGASAPGSKEDEEVVDATSDDKEGWLATHLDGDGISSSTNPGDIADIPDVDGEVGGLTAGEEDDLAKRVAGTSLGADEAKRAGLDAADDIAEIPDMDDEDELGELAGGVVEDDPATAASYATASKGATAGTSNLISVRKYDCLITYDKYYQTPRMWLVGYDESGRLLKPQEVFEDVSSDYAQKTVTVEPFPHAPMSAASVHPCKHASVMKKVIERMDGAVGAARKQQLAEREKEGKAAKKSNKPGWLGGSSKKSSSQNEKEPSQPDEEEEIPEGLRVDQYMLIFLKFMASIVPAIEIDATQAM
ncbi:hypothetical protein IE81DRAFT_336450 [Ceraceosorus guamensis]|uniref:Autophagy-related protein 3 n=1 Tax=Ceraceosorus guamensis TaxID=1522189 RepID=A0A316W5J7_9BASI|nr:hypothetical protein IE81DRAFT_336450 [Ceraceosorus guamensis]PWN45119.1 hypothetical protein IE81DRAFT_336450 [Ceraceosorus guamensis]